jgi:signal recognition particle GTPase
LPFISRSQLEVTIGIPDTEDFSNHLKSQESVYEEINKLKESLREVVELVKKQKVEPSEEARPIESEYSLRALNLMNKLINKGVAKDVAKAIIDAGCGYDYELRRLDLKGETYESLKMGLESTLNADTPQRLRECIGELSSMDVVLVDTAGRSHYDDIKVKELVPFFNELPTLEIYFTVSANMDERVMAEALERFSVLPIKGLIFTKMDETIYHGYVLNLAYRTKLPILCWTTGQRVPKDLVMANYEYLAKLFLKVEE